MKEGTSPPERKIWIIASIMVLFVIGVQITNYAKEQRSKDHEYNTTSTLWHVSYKNPLNITVLETEATHYSVETPQYIYPIKDYYTVKTIPDTGIIQITRDSEHKVIVYFWGLQENGLYRLIEMGVYQ